MLTYRGDPHGCPFHSDSHEVPLFIEQFKSAGSILEILHMKSHGNGEFGEKQLHPAAQEDERKQS